MSLAAIASHIPAYDQVSCRIVKKSLTDFRRTVNLYAKSANDPYFNKRDALFYQVLYFKSLIKMAAGHFGYSYA